MSVVWVWVVGVGVGVSEYVEREVWEGGRGGWMEIEGFIL